MQQEDEEEELEVGQHDNEEGGKDSEQYEVIDPTCLYGSGLQHDHGYAKSIAKEKCYRNLGIQTNLPEEKDQGFSWTFDSASLTEKGTQITSEYSSLTLSIY